MIEPQRGFGIDGVEYCWGALPGAIAGTGRLPSVGGYLHRDVPCRSAFGFAAAGATVSAPAADRPVLAISYELATPRWVRARADQWLSPLEARFGKPTLEGSNDLSRHHFPASGVVRWARWERPTVGISLSLYGGLRSGPLGGAAGRIALEWTDVIAASTPFLPAWRAASAAMEVAAESVRGFKRFDVPTPLNPAVGQGGDASDLFAARRALARRTILATPTRIAERLDRRAFALWQSVADGRWALSSVWDSVALAGARVAWIEMRPAKGSGRSELALEGWSIAMPYGTSAIAAAATALEALPGVVVEAYEEDDA